MLAARFLLPASTPPVRKRQQVQRRRGIASLERLRIGGADQWVLIRSEDVVANPILLVLHGGPGVSEMTLNRRVMSDLERYFTVVNWDQRGAGKSYKAGRDEAKMTIPQFVEDTRELSQYLMKRFGKRKIILQGRSWGSALGMLTVAKYPELFYAYVGIGQITDVAESEKASYRWTLEQAKARSDRQAVRELQAMGPPPYTGDWLQKFNTQRKYVARFGGEVQGNRLGGNGKIIGSLLISEEYTLMDRIAYNSAVQDSLRLVQPQLMTLNLFRSVPNVEVPVFFVEGRHDHVVPAHLAARYFEALEAPAKELVWFEDSAHMPDIEERKRFQRLLVERVLPLAKG
jgi:pimeloyl-ACP methyl ester carboxylesterase